MGVTSDPGTEPEPRLHEQGEGARAQGHRTLGSIEIDDHRLGPGIGQVRDRRTRPTAQTQPHTSGVRITTGIVLVVFR
jgi:hypothetical protein